MKTLGEAQRRAGHRVWLGLLLTRRWPYRKELDGRETPSWVARSPALFGTAAFVFHWFVRNPVRHWAKRLQREAAGAPAIVHYHSGWLSGALALPSAEVPGVRQVATFHGLIGREVFLRQRIRRWIHREMAQRLLRLGCVLTSVDRANLPGIEELFGIDPQHFRVVPNGVNGVPATHERSRNGTEPLRVGHLGVIDDGKGWRVTAEAVQRLHEAAIGVQLTVAGSGPEQEEARQWCQEHAAFARFLGYVPDASERLLPQLDVLCLASRREGLPMVILEALAAGTVVIASPVGGIPEAIDDGVQGFLVSRDAGRIAGALQRLAGDRALLARMSEAAERRFRERYTAEAMCRGYEQVYGLTT